MPRAVRRYRGKRAEAVARIIARRFKADCHSLPGDYAEYTTDSVALHRANGTLVAIMSRELPWFRDAPRKSRADGNEKAKGEKTPWTLS